MGEERKVSRVLVGKPEETTWKKTNKLMGGWLSYGDWLGECRVDPVG
jgi:hypothetical protein